LTGSGEQGVNAARERHGARTKAAPLIEVYGANGERYEAERRRALVILTDAKADAEYSLPARVKACGELAEGVAERGQLTTVCA